MCRYSSCISKTAASDFSSKGTYQRRFCLLVNEIKGKTRKDADAQLVEGYRKLLTLQARSVINQRTKVLSQLAKENERKLGFLCNELLSPGRAEQAVSTRIFRRTYPST